MNNLDQYLSHFGLKTRPFSMQPDAAFLYWAPSHSRAWSMIEYGLLTAAPIILLTGEVGTGKTTLLRHMLREADDSLTIALVANAHGTRGTLLDWVMQALGLDLVPGEPHVMQFDRFQAYVIGEYAESRRVMLVIDEAQNLGRDALEELRMLTNINADSDELIQLVLIGQPELRDMIRRPDMVQFAQRVTAAFHLSAMSAEDIRAYIAHRLEVVGGPADLFSDPAMSLIYKTTEGVPRLVNQLCELAMLYAFSVESKVVSHEIVQQVLGDGVFFGGGAAQSPRLILSAQEEIRQGNDKRGES